MQRRTWSLQRFAIDDVGCLRFVLTDSECPWHEIALFPIAGVAEYPA
jgi:hypothetical protein